MRALSGLFVACLLAGCAVQADRPLTVAEAQRAAQANADIAIHYLRQGQLAEARERAARALRQDADYVPAHLVAAEIEARLDQPQAAERHYRAALDIAPRSGPALNNYAGFLCGRGALRRALDLYELAGSNRLYERRGLALANAGQCLADAGRHAEAMSYWRRALAAAPSQRLALRGLIDGHLRRGETDAAWALFSRYTADSRETPWALRLAARIARRAGDIERAEALTQRLRQRYPAADRPDAAAMTE